MFDVRPFLRDNVELFGVLTFCVGVITGHRLALWRDRRKEFNDVADEIHPVLFKFMNNTTAYTKRPSDYDFISLRRRMVWWKRWRFDAALAKYKTANDNQKGSCNSAGEVIYDDTTELKNAIRNLLNHMERQ